jgi:hypothetical protein
MWQQGVQRSIQTIFIDLLAWHTQHSHATKTGHFPVLTTNAEFYLTSVLTINRLVL